METILAKTKGKDHSELEFLRGKVRMLEKQVRTLEKQVRQSEKQITRYQRVQHLVDDAHETLLEISEFLPNLESPKPVVFNCGCGTGDMVLKFDYPELNKKIYQCTGCGCTKSEQK